MRWSNGRGWDQGALEHGKELCSSSSPTRCSRTKPADKNEKTAKKKKLRKPGCHNVQPESEATPFIEDTAIEPRQQGKQPPPFDHVDKNPFPSPSPMHD